MKVDPKWRQLGWRHPLWDFVRFYSVLNRQKKVERERWIANLKASRFEVEPGHSFTISAADVALFFDYLEVRDKDFSLVFKHLRTEDEALEFCKRLDVVVGTNVTQLSGYYQSSKALVAAVTAVAESVCDQSGTSFDPNPQRRCVWLVDHKLHVTARNLDGAIPSLANPSVVWEIKEYWGKTSGGSKMSDAVYECNLVGRELRDFEERSGARIAHIVFVDGKEQWASRASDLRRFIDLFHQGLIDYLLIGREVQTDWESTLFSLLNP